MQAMPNFMNGPYFDSNKMALKANAPKELKDKFEKWVNTMFYSPEVLEDDYPEFQSPYYTWKGEVIDKKKPDGWVYIDLDTPESDEAFKEAMKSYDKSWDTDPDMFGRR